MFERFTRRARRVLAVAQEESRMLNHDHIGTGHILLGLIHEGGGAAATALEPLGISLEAARQQVEDITGTGRREAPPGHIPFNPRARKMLELSQREALQLGCSYIGTEHILLGLIREGEGVAAQVLIKRGADLNRLRQQVIQILGDSRGEEELGTAHPAPRTGPAGGRQSRLLPEVLSRAEPADALRAAAGQRAGTGPDVSDLDQQIAQARRDMASAVSTEDYESAATLRDRERQLLAEKASRHQQRATAHLDLPSLAEGLGWLGDDVGRIRGLLRQQGAGPAAASSTSGRSRQ